MPEYDLQLFLTRRGWRQVRACLSARELDLWVAWLGEHPECKEIRIARSDYAISGEPGVPALPLDRPGD